MSVPVRLVPGQVVDHPTLGIMEAVDPGVSRGGEAAGQKDQGELEPLGGVDRHDLHLGPLRLLPVQVGRLVCGPLPQGLETVEQVLQVQAGPVGLLLQGAQDVAVVGDPPLPVAAPDVGEEHARILEKRLEELGPAAAGRQFPPSIEKTLDRTVGGAVQVAGQIGQGDPAGAGPAGEGEEPGQEGLQEGLPVPGPGHRREEHLELAGLVALPEPGFLVVGIRNAAGLEGPLHLDRLGPGPHQDGHVPRRHGAGPAGGGEDQLRPRAEEPGDLPGGPGGHGPAGLPGLFGPVQPDQREGGPSRPIPVDPVAGPRAGVGHGGEGDFLPVEPLPAGEEVVAGGDEIGMGAPVHREGVEVPPARSGQLGPGGQVGVDVGAPEAVDRLLRVADEEDAPVPAGHEEAPEDPPLQGVRVLEFVHQGIFVAAS